MIDTYGPTTDGYTVDKIWELDHRYFHRYL